MNLNHTTNYALPSWESSDRILMEDFNDAFETIDTQMKAHSDAIAGKAAQSTVNSLTQTVNTKANQSDLTALTQTVSGKASQADLNSLTQTVDGLADQVGLRGNCQIYYTTYTGDGQSSKSLTFPAMPLVVLIQYGDTLFPAVRGATQVPNSSRDPYRDFYNVTWGDTSLSWSCGTNGVCANYNGYTYHVVAFLRMGETDG